jgi:hypothetical protein
LPIELSDYLVDTLSEAKRLLEVKSDLGRIPLSKNQLGFRDRVMDMIDEWFESEPNRSREYAVKEPSLPDNPRLMDGNLDDLQETADLGMGSALADKLLDSDDEIPF